MKKILIASFDMEVGGVERSLISMLNSFDYNKHEIDLMLYRHQGDFMPLLPKMPTLLQEDKYYSTFRKSIGEIIREKNYTLAFSRLLSKLHTSFYKKVKGLDEAGYYQMQLMWKYCLPFLPSLDSEYDVAISYLWPHYFIADKVKARKKIAWIHTDYSNIDTDVEMDLQMWDKFDYIIAVSDACRDSFLGKYKKLKEKTVVIENIISQEFITIMGDELLPNPLKNDERFKILTVARLSHAKGIDNAVKALKILKDKGLKDIVWYIVGYGGDEDFLKELISKYNMKENFILLGKKINPYPFIKACDLYVQPSRYEGKAVTVTEAQILGKPVLITNYPTAKSQVENGFDGVITKNLSIEGLAEEIEKLYRNEHLRNRLCNNLKDINFSNSYELEKLYRLLV